MEASEQIVLTKAETEAEKFTQKLRSSGVIPNYYLIEGFKNAYISGYLAASKKQKHGLLSRLFNW